MRLTRLSDFFPLRTSSSSAMVDRLEERNSTAFYEATLLSDFFPLRTSASSAVVNRLEEDQSEGVLATSLSRTKEECALA